MTAGRSWATLRSGWVRRDRSDGRANWPIRGSNSITLQFQNETIFFQQDSGKEEARNDVYR